ncbi:MAG: hypothetical protein IKP06_01425 [Elusimicrobiaceae bacterium]|nr:hypothetical protein [Elusimicrobiaceae bacterium]
MKTKVIFNDTIPFKGFIAMCLWPFIFVRNNAASHYNTVANNHEHIHAEQQKEMLLVGIVLAAIGYVFVGLWALLFVPLFFWWYGIEYLYRLCQYRDTKKAYRNISTEREAYANEKDLTYLTNRRRFAWIKYLHI